ncbi:MAG: dipicolinate synthase subunit DpsA [Oscillospiraceae bacterium]|jgi:dipicolinate synthase subunit A|nr:dipicolinate synthase subunit DpsA [Oscillospiraceae bacterium]
MEAKTIAIFGGDKRFLFCGGSLAQAGCNVLMFGFDQFKTTEHPLKEKLTLTNDCDLLTKADCVILPPQPIDADGCVAAPLNSKPLHLNQKIAEIIKNKKIFAGFEYVLKEHVPQLAQSDITDYPALEEFAVLNAVPSAEGAIGVAIENFEGTLHGAKCLVCGYGRIGKVLAADLSSLHAKVTVSARKPTDLALITAFGHTAIETSAIANGCDYDIIFNTIPRLIFDERTLKKTNPAALIIDLASKPGGVDFKAARKLNIDTIHALSLPGKTAPRAAGEIIATTILNCLNTQI